MPRALDPNTQIPIVLDGDADKPEELRPTFFIKAMSTKEWAEVIRVADEHSIKDQPIKAFEGIFTALRLAIVSWKNMIDPRIGKAVEYSQGELENILDPAEAKELVDKIVRSPFLTELDAKKSESPSPFNTGCSAKSAPVGSAATGQANPAPSASNA